MSRGELQPNVSSFDALTSFSPRFWLFLVLTGAGAGLAGGLLMAFLHAVQHCAWSYESGTFLEGVEHNSTQQRVLVLLGAGALVGVCCWLLHFKTGVRGGDLAEAIWFRAGKLPVFWTFGRAILSVLAVGLGASVGREGALKQAGAGIAAWLGGENRLPSGQRRLLVACGAGAGMAAAYDIPFAGALFALEVFLGELTLPLVGPALIASSIGTAVSWVLLPNQPTYTFPASALTMPLLIWALLAGPLFGVVSVAYVRLFAWVDARKPKGWGLLLGPVLMFAVLGLLSIVFPQLLGNGKDVVQLSFNGEIGIELLVALFFLKVLATAGCIGSGTPGGLFTPTITCGALLGGALGWVWSLLWPGAPAGCYALIGAGAMLAATTQGPLSAIVAMLELTRHVDPFIVPLLAAVAGAVLVARAVDPTSVYTARLRVGKSACSLADVVPRTCFDEWITRECEVVSAATPYGEVVPRLLALAEGHWPLYALDEQGHIVGVIELSQATGAGLPVPLETATASDLASPVPILDSTMTAEQVEKTLRESNLPRLPVVDVSSGQLIGVVAKSVLREGR